MKFLSDGGEMGRRIRAYDWANHPLGESDAWPQALRTVVGLMLKRRPGNRFPDEAGKRLDDFLRAMAD